MIGFNENGTSFSDEEKAKHNIESLISEMKRNINETVTITGFVSTVSHSCNDDRIDNALAENRAARIKQLLIDNGISADRIKAVSGGKGQKANECEGGTYNADLAKSNMYVKIRAEM
jgi:outer membrane protein OmpA-like peptidoglycan-associated protein